MKIAFAILSYNAPEQLLLLVKTLSKMFCAPPIVCHHNFDQCGLNEELFPPNVRFVHPHIYTRWGHITTPLAALKAFELLRKNDHPDWYILLSGSDYPVRTSSEILAELATGEYDAYLDNRQIPYSPVPPSQKIQQGGFGESRWVAGAYGRYCAYPLFWWPRPSKQLLLSGSAPFQKHYVSILNPTINQWLQPNRPIRIHGGAFWFQANHKAVDSLLDNPSLNSLIDYYRSRRIPEESLFHTALCNPAGLRICSDYKRYEDWSQGLASPKWLEETDLPRIIASRAYFARKFRSDCVVQSTINRTVLGI